MEVATPHDGAPGSPSLRAAIERPDLQRELDRGVCGRLTLVVAPAGSGKTVTVGQWARGRPEVRWISAGERERDVRGFAQQLVDAVGERPDGRPLAPSEWLDPRGDRLGEQFVDGLLGGLVDVNRPLTLVVDDVDRLGPAVHADLRQFVAGAPPGVRLVGIARVDPDLGQARLRAYGDAVEIRIEQLRFDPHSTRDLVERVSSCRLDDAQLATVMSLTEGWPIAVHLAGLALRAAGDVGERLAAFASSDRNVEDFLSEEVFKQLDGLDRDLLVRTSVLPVLDGDLCDAVLGSVGSGARLDDLERRGVLLSRLADGRYRLHRLIRAYLRAELDRTGSAAANEVLRAAAACELARGDVEAAGEHLAEAREWGALRDLVVDTAGDAWQTMSYDPLRRQIGRLPPEHRDPILLLTSALLDLLAGHHESTAATLTALEGTDLTPGERMVALNISGALVSSMGSFDRVRRAAVEVEALAPTVPLTDIPPVAGVLGATLRPWCRVHAAQADMFLGELTAEDGPSDVDHLAALQPLLAVNALGGHAVRAAMSGRLNEAVSAAHRSAFMAVQLGQRHPSRAFSPIALGMVAFARDELEVADELLTEALGILEQWRRLSWVHLVMIEQARVADALGLPGATDLTDHLTALPTPRSSPWMEDRALAVEAAAWWRRGDRARVEATLERRGPGAVDGTLGLRVTLAVEDGDLSRASTLLGTWPACGRYDGQIRRVLDGVVRHLDGDASAATDLVRVVDDLERAGNVRLVVDAGRRAIDVLQAVVPGSDLLRRARLRAGPVELRMRPLRGGGLVDGLTDRELAVLAYLPTRLTNAEIASALYVSVHTIRTHLKHIYQKLAVGTRDEAIGRAAALGLIERAPSA